MNGPFLQRKTQTTRPKKHANDSGRGQRETKNAAEPFLSRPRPLGKAFRIRSKTERGPRSLETKWLRRKVARAPETNNNQPTLLTRSLSAQFGRLGVSRKTSIPLSSFAHSLELFFELLQLLI